MTENKRTSALPNDPLAWLDLPDRNEQAAAVTEPKPDEQAALDAAAPDATVESVDVPTESSAAMQDDDEGGFGFFVNEDVETVRDEPPADDEDGGFGFFANDEQPASNLEDSDLINLESTLTIKNVEDWHKKLADKLSAGEDLVFDAEDLVQVDGCGLQLLCSVFVSAAANGVTVKWNTRSDRLSASADYFGVSKLLKLDSEEQKAA